ncbi:MAG: hypothetical protein Q8M29_16565 [Bacteroidota bacterium]|nr:hypothetical protein [Bacteroidota bacterium]
MIKKLSTYLFLLVALQMFVSCGKNEGTTETANESTEAVASVSVPSSLGPKDYINWIEDPGNGLIADKTIGEFTFSAFYKPLDYLALSDLEIDSTLKEELPKKIKEYEGMDYFSFRINSNADQSELLRVGIKEESEYYARLEYFSFKMQNDFKLISGGDTANCVLYHYERVYGLAPHASFVLGFPKNVNSKNTAKQLLFEDKIFNKGNIYITIPKEKLNHIPKLEI